jgi:PAS domain S-box-containing protein
VTPQIPSQREQQLARAIEESSDTVVRFDFAGAIVCISAGARVLLGCEPDGLTGTDLIACVHPLDRNRVAASWRAIRDGSDHTTCSYCTLRKDGRHTWTESTFEPIVDGVTGCRDEIVGVMRDISARAGSVDSLDQNAGSVKLLVDSFVDYAIYLLDLVGTVQTWNAGAQRIEGYTADEIIGSNFSVFYTPEDERAGEPQHSLAIALATGRFEAKGWRVRKNGTRLFASVVIDVVRNPAGEIIGFAKITRDVTQSGALRRVNEESASIAQLLVDSVVDYAIYLLDLDGNVKSWNAGAQRIKGYSAREIIGSHFSVFYTAPRTTSARANPPARWRSRAPTVTSRLKAGACAKTAAGCGQAS